MTLTQTHVTDVFSIENSAITRGFGIVFTWEFDFWEQCLQFLLDRCQDIEYLICDKGNLYAKSETTKNALITILWGTLKFTSFWNSIYWFIRHIAVQNKNKMYTTDIDSVEYLMADFEQFETRIQCTIFVFNCFFINLNTK